MYPHATQFETRDRLVQQQLELLRARETAARKADARPNSRRVGLTPSHLSALVAALLPGFSRLRALKAAKPTQ